MLFQTSRCSFFFTAQKHSRLWSRRHHRNISLPGNIRIDFRPLILLRCLCLAENIAYVQSPNKTPSLLSLPFLCSLVLSSPLSLSPAVRLSWTSWMFVFACFGRHSLPITAGLTLVRSVHCSTFAPRGLDGKKRDRKVRRKKPTERERESDIVHGIMG